MKPADQIASIAREHLGIPTLEVRRSDSLDFHEVAVWSLADALDAAFEAGKQSRDSVATLPRIARQSSGKNMASRASRIAAAAPDLLDAVLHVLAASEDGGDMNDIDWNLLRTAVQKATYKGDAQ